MNGQRVLQLAEQNLQEGYYHFAWDGKAANGQVLTSGYYFARTVVNPTGSGETRVLTQRMLFMK
jgi:flagellar hook assembly protein FlgD